MADASFDAVIIGGGTKSIVTAIYLAKYGGMSVGIFEERRELCSGLTSEIGFVPGFVADCHATGIGIQNYLPVQEDFPGFEEKGGRVFTLPGTFGGIMVEDHSCWVRYNLELDPTQERTAKELARFSCERDAETYLKLWEVTKPGTDYELAMLQEQFNPPPLPGQLSPLERWFENYMAQPDCLIDESWYSLPAINAVPRLWERPGVSYIFLRFLVLAGQQINLMPGLLIFGLPGAREVGYALGGTHSIAHAYQRTLHEVGGKWFPFKKVEKIIIENGTAKGIRLADGTQVEARKLVVGGVNPHQLCFDLIGKDHISAKMLRKVETLVGNIKGLFWYSYFLHELPKYKAADFNPDINQCGTLVLGTDDLQILHDYDCWIRLGQVPPIRGLMALHPHTVVDKTRAPEGKHEVLEDSDCPTATKLSEREWLRIKKTHLEDALGEWQKYAPNMTWDNLIGSSFQTPYDAARRGLNFWPHGNAGIIDNFPGQIGRTGPIPELAHFRTPIKNLYGVGTWRKPVGGSHCGPGYACYKVIAEDLGLRKPWEEKGRPY